jgi:hypothetical protein
MNPTPLKGFDIRGIIVSDDPGVGLANPDDYTDLFDNGGAVTINPFKAYAKAVTDRSFGPGELFTEHYDLWLLNFGKVAMVDFAIDASWPGRAKEPYKIGGPFINGEIDDTGQNIVEITADVFAANNDVDEVWLDCSTMGFSGPLAMQYVSGTTWKIDFQNTPQAPASTYRCLVKASTASSAKFLYDYFNLTVVPGTPMVSLADDVQPIFDAKCTYCHDGGEPPDLRAGYTWAALVNADSHQSSVPLVSPGDPYLSYNQAKIRGTHKNAPYNGSGKQMPWFDPYITPQELEIIDTWIEQGALNN